MRITESYLRNVIRTTLKGVLREMKDPNVILSTLDKIAKLTQDAESHEDYTAADIHKKINTLITKIKNGIIDVGDESYEFIVDDLMGNSVNVRDSLYNQLSAEFKKL